MFVVGVRLRAWNQLGVFERLVRNAMISYEVAFLENITIW